MKRRTNVKENRVYGAVTYLYLLPLHIHFSIVELLISRLNSSASWTEADTSQTQIAANATTNCRCSYSMNLMHCLPNALLLPVTMAFKKYQQRWWYTHHGGYHAHDNKTSKRQKHNFGWFVMSLPLYCVPCIYTSHIAHRSASKSLPKQQQQWRQPEYLVSSSFSVAFIPLALFGTEKTICY